MLVSYSHSLLPLCSGIVCRLAIRAASFGPKPTLPGQLVTDPRRQEPWTEETRGSFKGAIRIALRSLRLFVNDLALPHVSRRSLKFHLLVFPIPTAPTKYPLYLQRFTAASAFLFQIRSGFTSIC
jgi:hypothetical protein